MHATLGREDVSHVCLHNHLHTCSCTCAHTCAHMPVQISMRLSTEISTRARIFITHTNAHVYRWNRIPAQVFGLDNLLYRPSDRFAVGSHLCCVKNHMRSFGKQPRQFLRFRTWGSEKEPIKLLCAFCRQKGPIPPSPSPFESY